MNASNRRTIRVAGALIGVLLIVAAITAVASRQDAMRSVLDSVRDAPLWMFAALAGSVAASPLLTAAVFYLLTRRYGTVTKGEMGALILTAWLLNYLPLWPGMVSRVAYHRVVNQIPVRASARVIVEAGVLSAIAAGLLAVLLLGVALPLGLSGWSAIAVGASGALVSAVVAGALLMSARPPEVWRYLAVIGVRTVELGVWALRYVLAAAIVGAEVSPLMALTIAALVQIAVLVPIAPNGLGVREWAVGLSASVFAAGISAETGLAIGLLDRGAEVLVAVPLGLLAAAWLARRRRQLGASTDPDDA
jgi:hypothetical protein